MMKKLLYLSLFFTCISFSAAGEELDLNEYYAFPVSAGFYYQQMSGIGNKNLNDFQINQIFAESRIPLPDLPYLQPLIKTGYADYTYTEDNESSNQDWSHKHLFAGPGIAYCNRISKEFEVGADIYAALSQSYFTELELNGEQQTFGQLNLFSGISGRLALNPSYNFSISLNPSFNFVYSFGDMHTYDGFSFGIGFSGSYRFGDDPDSSGTSIRAIRFDNIEINSLYSAMQSYYVNNPAGLFTITNKEKRTIEDLSISFMQQGFMDSPSPIANGITLQPGESLELPLLLSFNNSVFTTVGITPLSGEIIATYSIRSRTVEQRESLTYDLHDRNAIVWDDDRKAAAFVTPQDSALRNYASYISRIHKEDIRLNYSRNFQFALQAYNALGELGIIYQADPATPFITFQENSVSVDTISLPRETLIRLSGDCDDLTVLYSALLESAGVDTAFITIPGHIFCAFNTKIPSSDYSTISPDRSNIIEYNGDIWIPVEITMIGKNDFFKAWNEGAKEFSDFNDAAERRGFYEISEAQKVYRPIALQETDLGLQYGNSTVLINRFDSEISTFIETVLGRLGQEAKENNTPGRWNSYGISSAKLGDYETAETAFNKAINLKSEYINARLNLGSLYFLQNKFSSALSVFEKTLSSSESLKISQRVLFKLYLNISRTNYALNENTGAAEYFNKAKQIYPAEALEFSYLGNTESTERAAETSTDILFF